MMLHEYVKSHAVSVCHAQAYTAGHAGHGGGAACSILYAYRLGPRLTKHASVQIASSAGLINEWFLPETGAEVRERVYAHGVCVCVCVCVHARLCAHAQARATRPDSTGHTHIHNGASTSCPMTCLSWTVYFGARVATAHLLLPPSTPHNTPTPNAPTITQHTKRNRVRNRFVTAVRNGSMDRGEKQVRNGSS